ncbi:MAG: THUMP domain-containing protein, partial [Pseudomonadota bacterium]
MKPFEIFCTCPPGLEPFLEAEALEKGFTGAEAVPGGVRFAGLWPNVMRANLHLRGATRVLARIARHEIHNLSQLERIARAIDWQQVFRSDVPLRIDASCKRSKINHAGAAKGRLERALAASLGAPITADGLVTLMLRIENNKAVFSVDTSGAPLHLRGTKQAVGKAPMRETMAALLLRAAGYDGR